MQTEILTLKGAILGLRGNFACESQTISKIDYEQSSILPTSEQKASDCETSSEIAETAEICEHP